jgi:hypothetical protein
MIDIEGPLSGLNISFMMGVHRRKGAARQIIDMVWLYRPSVPEGGGVIVLVRMISSCLRGD